MPNSKPCLHRLNLKARHDPTREWLTSKSAVQGIRTQPHLCCKKQWTFGLGETRRSYTSGAHHGTSYTALFSHSFGCQALLPSSFKFNVSAKLSVFRSRKEENLIQNLVQCSSFVFSSSSSLSLNLAFLVCI